MYTEIIAAGSSKQPIIDTGDDESSASANKLESTDDLLIEILLRLPLISLRLFKSVSKRWLSLIADPNFTLLRSKNPNIDPPSGFFLQQPSASSEFAYVALDARIPGAQSPLITTFTFDLNSDYIEVLQACNGLMLCCIRPDKFYAYNPTVNRYKMLPLPNVWEPNRIISDMAIAFDPKISPHYKVLYPIEDYSNNDIPVRVEIYTSETGEWNVCSRMFEFEKFEGFNDFVYWNDAIHWIDYSDEVFHFDLNLENPRFIEVATPKTLNGKAYRDDKLLESRGCLLLVKMVQPMSLQMNVYELKIDYSGWSVVYHVNLVDISTSFCGKFEFLPRRYMVRAIVLREGEEDPFLVVEVPGKLLRYDIISKTYYELCELVPIRPRVTKFCSFLFIASLAGV
ncbi:F-box protein-like protein [Tanacetum coccineum]